MNVTINDYVEATVKIKSVETIADGVKEITFDCPPGVKFAPGQFVGIEITMPNGEKGFRSYSVLSDKESNLQICVKKVEGGRGSVFLHQQKVGGDLKILFPLGYFSFPQKLKENLFFVATGTGLVPILSLLENLEKMGFKGKAKLFFSVRSEKDLFYEARIKAWAQRNSNFSVIISLSQPGSEWKGLSGRGTVFLEKEPLGVGDQVFVCGNGSMIQSVREISLKKGVRKKNIIYEDFN